MANNRKFKIGDTIYYKTLNNRVGKGVIKAIKGKDIIVAYEIKTKFMVQQRTISRTITELFVTKSACEMHIKTTVGEMGTPTTKICKQFYKIDIK